MKEASSSEMKADKETDAKMSPKQLKSDISEDRRMLAKKSMKSGRSMGSKR